MTAGITIPTITGATITPKALTISGQNAMLTVGITATNTDAHTVTHTTGIITIIPHMISAGDSIDTSAKLKALLETANAQYSADDTALLTALGTSKFVQSFESNDKKSKVIFFTAATPTSRVTATGATTWDLALDRSSDSFKATYGATIVTFLNNHPNVTFALEVVVGTAATNPATEKNDHARLFMLYSGSNNEVLAGAATASLAISAKT